MAIAARGQGIVTTAELHAAGLTRHAIASRVARGWLTRIHRGVFLVGAIAGPWGLEAAALKACGGEAVLSHGSGGAIWGMRPRPEGAVELSIPGTTARRHAGVRVRRTVRLEPGETTRRHGLAVTTPVRTLLDLAVTVSTSELERAVNEALVGKVAARAGLLSALERGPAHHGAGRLRAALMDDGGITRSAAERAFEQLIGRSGIPRPLRNVKVAGYEVDCHWPELGLVVEIDGAGFHGTPRAFQADRDKDAALNAAGRRLIRITRFEVIHRPEATIARVATAIATAATAARPP